MLDGAAVAHTAADNDEDDAQDQNDVDTVDPDQEFPRQRRKRWQMSQSACNLLRVSVLTANAYHQRPAPNAPNAPTPAAPAQHPQHPTPNALNSCSQGSRRAGWLNVVGDIHTRLVFVDSFSASHLVVPALLSHSTISLTLSSNA